MSNKIIVHIDLKGKLYQPIFVAQLFPALKKMGAHSVLLEWENTLPFEDNLAHIKSNDSYTKEEVATIVSSAKKAGSKCEKIPNTF